MSNLKPVGSEKLPIDQKIKRIMEIATYGTVEKKETHKTASLEYSITAADGNNYGIIRENSQYSILKEGEQGYRYMDGMLNNKKYSFPSFSKALKKLNLLMKPLNENFMDGKQLNLIGEQEEDTKYVLKTPEVESEEDFSLDLEGGDEGEFSGEDFDVEEDMEGEEDFGGEEEISVDVETPQEEEENFTKAIQKLTGKLGQKLRDVPTTELDGDLIKYVINSIISAVDLTKLSPEDVEDIVNKIEGEEETEYTEEGEFEVELSGDEELDMDFEDEKTGGEEELDLETELMETEVGDEELNEFWPAVARAASSKAGQAAIGAGVDYGLRKAFDEESKLKADYDDTEIAFDAADAIADIFSEGKTHQTLTKYFKYTQKEKEQRRATNQQNKRITEKRKSKFLNNILEETNVKRKIKSSISTYEQELTVKNFLNENKNPSFVGTNQRGSLIFKNEGQLVEINKYGRKI
jgi:hypothetical protein